MSYLLFWQRDETFQELYVTLRSVAFIAPATVRTSSSKKAIRVILIGKWAIACIEVLILNNPISSLTEFEFNNSNCHNCILKSSIPWPFSSLICSRIVIVLSTLPLVVSPGHIPTLNSKFLVVAKSFPHHQN